MTLTSSQAEQQPAPQLAERLGNLYWAIAVREPSLGVVTEAFHNEASLEPSCCDLYLLWIKDLRRAVLTGHDGLIALDQKHTSALSVQASITKLEDLDEQLMEALLCLAMFSEICQQVLMERVELHLHLRFLLEKGYLALQDTLSQLTALTEMAMFLPQEGTHAA